MAEAIAPPLPVSSELPVPVRLWVERGREMKAVYVIWSCFFFGLATMSYVAVTMNSRWTLATIVVELLLLKASALPWIGHGLWRLLQTRRAIEAGVTLDDLRHGLDVAVERREEELRYEMSRPVHWFPKLVRWGTYLMVAGALASLFGGVFISSNVSMSRTFFQFFGLFTMATVGGAMFGLLFPGRRLGARDGLARLRRWLWHGPAGLMMARIAAIGLRKSPTTAWASWRPTESALGSATETLFDALPEPQRRALSDLPIVVARLEREAARAREQLEQGADGGWAERLTRAVGAIETLRVGLLRMNAGNLATGSLTADLDAARELSERIDYLVAGSDEASAALSRGSRQSSTQPIPNASAPSTSLG
jgi:hypothetical protein